MSLHSNQGTATSTQRPVLWAALFFPQLHIDMQVQHHHDDLPTAVIIQEGARRLIMSSNHSARDIGIHPGLTLNGAYAIAPELQIIDYDETNQQKLLEQLCLWAMQYSSWVTPRLPNIVLLEINASLKLFGGLEALLGKLESDCENQGLNMQIGIAPTPSAASLFARIGNNTRVTTKQQLLQLLDDIPTEYLPFDAFTLKGLRQSGIKNCKQLFRLPPAALTRRFGKDAIEFIYQLTGKLPDICPAFTVADSFSRKLDLPLEAPDASALQFPLNRLTSALGGFLKSSDLGVKSMSVVLTHHQVPETKLTVTFLEATADYKHIFRVISERLANTAIPAPAISIALASHELDAISHDNVDLFKKSQSQTTSIQGLLDNLSARLGEGRLYTPIVADDHRPEKAWYSSLLSNNHPPSDWPARPIWLLREPEPAHIKLHIESTAERIENGWWDKTDVRRDYYIARDRAGAYYWVFSDRKNTDRLFIHGLFS